MFKTINQYTRQQVVQFVFLPKRYLLNKALKKKTKKIKETLSIDVCAWVCVCACFTLAVFNCCEILLGTAYDFGNPLIIIIINVE